MQPGIGRLVVVCPMANEAGSGERFVDDVLKHCHAGGAVETTMVAVLDRASTDGTLDLLREVAARQPALRVVWFPESRGVVDAYFRGYREALDLGADWILEMDAGYSHLPEQIPRFLAAAGPAACVFATRFTRGGCYEGGWSGRYFISRAGGLLSRVLLGLRLDDTTSGFELYSRAALERVVRRGVRSRGPFFQTEIKYLLRDLPCAQVPITYVPTGQVPRAAAVQDSLWTLGRMALQRLVSADWRSTTGRG